MLRDSAYSANPTNPGCFDALETRDPAVRERDLLACLPALVARAQQTPGFARLLAGIDAREIDSRTALAQLPVLRKSDLKDLQAQTPPFGGLSATTPGGLARIYFSPGPIFDPEGRGTDWWRFARPLYAAGIRGGQIVHNSFSYHLTPAGFMADLGAQHLGCAVVPAGTGNTEMQARIFAALRPDAYIGTPSFLKIIIEKGRESALPPGLSFAPPRHALVAGEALPPSLRQWLRDAGVGVVTQIYATADLGCIAYETQSGGEVHPGMVIDESLLVEIVRPGSGEPVAPGEIGEVVVTHFNRDYPLIRFATGDLSAFLPEFMPEALARSGAASPCGRTGMRLKGWLGRADQTTKVRGMFVHPSQIAEVLARHPQIGRARLVVANATNGTGSDEMTLLCETEHAEDAASDLKAALVQTLREITKLRGEVRFVAPGSLPGDGKTISDERSYT